MLFDGMVGLFFFFLLVLVSPGRLLHEPVWFYSGRWMVQDLLVTLLFPLWKWRKVYWHCHNLQVKNITSFLSQILLLTDILAWKNWLETFCPQGIIELSTDRQWVDIFLVWDQHLPEGEQAVPFVDSNGFQSTCEQWSTGEADLMLKAAV